MPGESPDKILQNASVNGCSIKSLKWLRARWAENLFFCFLIAQHVILWALGLHFGFPYASAIIISITEERKNCLGFTPQAEMIIIPWSEPSLSSPQLQWFRDVIQGSLCVCPQTFFISSLEIASRETWKSGYVFFHGWTGVRMQKLMFPCKSLRSRQLTSILSRPWLQSQYAMKDSAWHRSSVPWANNIHPGSPDHLWLLWGCSYNAALGTVALLLRKSTGSRTEMLAGWMSTREAGSAVCNARQ